jgi:RNA polymerase sigma factor (sigma-70 family)
MGLIVARVSKQEWRREMDADLAAVIQQVQQGDTDAYEPIVRRFQDMAVGYGYARLGDVQLAEDAAQEAFITAYIALPSLHEPAAFPGWFRRIVIKHIDRIQRKRRAILRLDMLANVAEERQNPVDLLEQQEVRDAVITAMQCLPVAQREVVTLFYMGAYSHTGISAFLDIPVSTVKMRLYHARKALAQHLLAQIEELLPDQRPSRDTAFMEKVMSYQVETKDMPAQQTIYMTRDSYIRDLQAHLDGGIKSLTVYAQQERAQVAGLPLAIYHGHVREDQHAPVEICLPVTGDIQATIEIAVKELPPARVAYTVITMRQSIYPGALKAYVAIEEWITSHGYSVADAPREIYLNFTTSIFSPTASLDDPCVEIDWPYR